jgi:hypothetical protein
MKRFTETTKWDDDWFMELSPVAKLLWQYLLDRCDNAGVVKINYPLMKMQIFGSQWQKDVDWQKYLKELETRIEIAEKGRLICVCRFIEYQYGDVFNSSAKAVISMRDKVLCKWVNTFQCLSKYSQWVSNGYAMGIDTHLDKDKDKDKDITSNKIGFARGDIPPEIIDALNMADGVTAAEFHDSAVQHLIDCNFEQVVREYTVMLPEGGGRIDIVVEEAGRRYAIELDNRSAKAKSIRKVELPQFHGGLVFLRDPFKTRQPDPGYSASFLEFWEAYPRKVGKGAAWSAWKSRKCASLKDDILQSVEAHKPEWSQLETRLIPHPSTFLNQRRWEDEIETAPGTLAKSESVAPANWREILAAVPDDYEKSPIEPQRWAQYDWEDVPKVYRDIVIETAKKTA